MPRTRIRSDQGQDISFVSEAELNQFLEAVVITGTEDATTVVQFFDDYFPGRGLIVGVDGNVVVTGTQLVTISGFRDEFLSASGTFLKNVVEDLTPQLGGDLDVNGQSITSAGNADVEIQPAGTGGIGLFTGKANLNPGTREIRLTTSGAGQILIDTVNNNNTGDIFIQAGDQVFLTTANVGKITIDSDGFMDIIADRRLILESVTETVDIKGSVGIRLFNPLLGENGTAAAPSFSFKGDEDMGVYRVAANQLGLVGAGQTIVTVTGLQPLASNQAPKGIGIDGNLTVTGTVGADVGTFETGLTVSGVPVDITGGGGGSGVDSLNSLTGALTLLDAGSVTITDDGSSIITISGAAASVAGADHSALNNLDFASAGHTGFGSSADTDALAASGVATDANVTVNAADIAALTTSGDGHLSNVVEDLTPQLGGDLDGDGNSITGVVDVLATATVSGTTIKGISGIIDHLQTLDPADILNPTLAINTDRFDSNSGLAIHRAGTKWPLQHFFRSRGSENAREAVQPRDVGGATFGYQWEGSAWEATSFIAYDVADSPVSTDTIGGLIRMGTRPATTSGILTEAIWIDHQQHVGIGDLPFISTSDKLTVGGTISGTSMNTGLITAATGTYSESLTVSGIPVRIDADSLDVGSLNSLTGDITVIGKGEVGVTVEGQNIVVSGTGHTAGGGGGGDVSDALVGTDGITVLSGTPTASETTISGFRDEFLSASGTFVKKTGDTMTGNLTIDSDSVGLILGDDQDATIFHDGTNLQIENSTGFTGISGAIFVAQDGDVRSRFGGEPTSFAGSDAFDGLVVRKQSIVASATRRGLFCVVDLDSDGTATARNFGLNAVIFTGEVNTIGNTNNTLTGGGCAGRYAFRHKSSGTWAMVGGVASHAIIVGDDEDGNITTGYGYLDEGSDGGAGIGSIGTYYGLWIKDSIGNVTTKNGIFIEALTNATTNIGIRIDGALTNALWLGAASEVTTAADGITFGLSKDVNLYRSGNDTLKTDDDFISLGTISGTNLIAENLITAASGTYTDSLTVSGTPVNIGVAGTNVSSTQLSETASSGTTSATYVLITGMVTTPDAGTYFTTFSTTIQGTDAAQQMQVALFHDGSIVQHSDRSADHASGAQGDDLHYPLHTQAILTVDGSQAIEARHQTDTGTLTVYERSLILLKLS